MSSSPTPAILDKIIGKDIDDDYDAFTPGIDYRAYGASRKAWGSEPMIDFISFDGNRNSFAYSHLYRVAMNPSDAVVIEFTSHTVTITGSKLHDLYLELLRNRVTFVWEADRPTEKLQSSNQESLITKIRINDRNNTNQHKS